MSKIITDELIEARLLKINVLEREDLDHDYMLKTIANHFDFKITSDWVNTPDYMFYTETTADGYEVCLLYTSPSPRDRTRSRMPSSA